MFVKVCVLPIRTSSGLLHITQYVLCHIALVDLYRKERTLLSSVNNFPTFLNVSLHKFLSKTMLQRSDVFDDARLAG